MLHYMVPSTKKASMMSERAGTPSILCTDKTVYFRNFVLAGCFLFLRSMLEAVGRKRAGVWGFLMVMQGNLSSLQDNGIPVYLQHMMCFV